MSIKAMKMAADAIMKGGVKEQAEAVYELRQAIEQAKKQRSYDAQLEPVALKVIKGEICYTSQEDDQSFGMWCPVTPNFDYFKEGTKFYTAPPKREWVGLTDEQIFTIADGFGEFQHGDAQGHKRLDFARAIEAKLKEKNI